jgi:hypothetical protein
MQKNPAIGAAGDKVWDGQGCTALGTFEAFDWHGSLPKMISQQFFATFLLLLRSLYLTPLFYFVFIFLRGSVRKGY